MYIIGFSMRSTNQRTTLILALFGYGLTVFRGKYGGFLGLLLTSIAKCY
jgi:hypothetical protein